MSKLYSCYQEKMSLDDYQFEFNIDNFFKDIKPKKLCFIKQYSNLFIDYHTFKKFKCQKCNKWSIYTKFIDISNAILLCCTCNSELLEIIFKHTNNFSIFHKNRYFWNYKDYTQNKRDDNNK